MSFLQAMTAPDTTKTGVNGTTVYTEAGVEDGRVALFTMLNRGLEKEYLQDAIRKLFAESDTHPTHQYQLDLFLMAFQTRDIRGGKGEKQLFYDMMETLYELDPMTTKNMMKHIPEYGCWRDMWELMSRVPELTDSIMTVVKERFLFDRVLLAAHSYEKMSLLSKWLPRENSKTYPGTANQIAAALYPFITSEMGQMMTYRKEVSAMNRAIKTVEVNMCNRTWAAIIPDAVPGRCLKMHTKAFFNQKQKGSEMRYSDSKDRMLCREHFLEFTEGLRLGTKKAHGAHVVMPHELIEKGLDYMTTAEEHDINEGQWVSILKEAEKQGGLGRAVAMCDFSGSMHGQPKLISLGLGILISELTHPAFRNHILTFDAEPRWHSFTSGATLRKKLQSISDKLGQGLNTDFYKACMSILKRMVQHRVPVGEEPEDLIVLTDMGFDAAAMERKQQPRQPFQTPHQPFQIESIRAKFVEEGEKLWGEGKGWKAPRIVVWNLRADYKDFHAKACQEGVVQLSGWSPNVLKALQKGPIQVTTPYQGLRKLLDDERYVKIAETWFCPSNDTRERRQNLKGPPF
jgi:hypothetical protein